MDQEAGARILRDGGGSANYSAMGRLKLVLITPQSDKPFTTASILSSKHLEKGYFKKMSKPAEGSGSPGIWKSYQLTVNDNGRHQGRYWRRIHMDSSTDASADIIDNAGWVTRETKIKIKKEIIWHESLNITTSELFIVE